MEIFGKRKETFLPSLKQKEESFHSQYQSIGQKLYDIVGIEIGRKGGITSMNKGKFDFKINKDWGVSGWYKKQPKNMGFNRSDYNFGFGVSRGI